MQITHNSSSLSIHLISILTSLTFRTLYNRSLAGWLLISQTLLKLNFFSLDSNNLPRYKNCPLSTTLSARNLGFIFDEHLTFSDQNMLLFPSPAIFTFVSTCILISKQPVPLHCTTSNVHSMVHQFQFSFCFLLSFQCWCHAVKWTGFLAVFKCMLNIFYLVWFRMLVVLSMYIT